MAVPGAPKAIAVDGKDTPVGSVYDAKAGTIRLTLTAGRHTSSMKRKAKPALYCRKNNA